MSFSCIPHVCAYRRAPAPAAGGAGERGGAALSDNEVGSRGRQSKGRPDTSGSDSGGGGGGEYLAIRNSDNEQVRLRAAQSLYSYRAQAVPPEERQDSVSSIVRTKDGLPVLGLAHLLVFAQEIGALSADVVAVSREIAQQAGAGEADADTPHPPQSSLAVTFQSRTGTTEAEPPPSQPEPVRHDPVDSWAAYDQSEANSREERGS